MQIYLIDRKAVKANGPEPLNIDDEAPSDIGT